MTCESILTARMAQGIHANPHVHRRIRTGAGAAAQRTATHLLQARACAGVQAQQLGQLAKGRQAKNDDVALALAYQRAHLRPRPRQQRGHAAGARQGSGRGSPSGAYQGLG